VAVVAAALDDDLRAAALSARSLGFAGVQLDVRLGELELTQLTQSGRREVRSVLRSQNLELAGLRFDLGGKGLGPAADIDAALDRVESVLQAAAGLECSLVCIDPGPLPAPPPEEKAATAISSEMAGDIIIPAARQAEVLESPRKFDSRLAASVDSALVELGRRADRHGVMIGFRSELAGFAAIERALKAAGCAWFGVDLDPVAMLRDDWSSDEIFSRLGDSVRHVRGRDAVLGADRRTKAAMIGSGSVDWGKLMNDLEGAGFNGWVTVDPMELGNRKVAAAGGATALGKIES
jgi:sugar phosphate isomerase/epimerase